MKIRRLAVLTILSILAAGVSSATVLTVFNPCVGKCPDFPSAGPIEIFSGSPGVFLDSAVMQFSIEHATPLNLNLKGTLVSAVFRDPSGQSGFYYQVSLNENSLAHLKTIGLGDLISSNYLQFEPDVGVRTDGLGTFGSVTFVPSAQQPTSIRLYPRYPQFDLNFLFDNNLLPPGDASATFVVLFGRSYSEVVRPSGSSFGLGVEGVDPSHPEWNFTVYPIGTGRILVPTTPEPGSLLLMGTGVLGLAGILRRKIKL